jgi:hypothetical protein
MEIQINSSDGDRVIQCQVEDPSSGIIQLTTVRECVRPV